MLKERNCALLVKLNVALMYLLGLSLGLLFSLCVRCVSHQRAEFVSCRLEGLGDLWLGAAVGGSDAVRKGKCKKLCTEAVKFFVLLLFPDLPLLLLFIKKIGRLNLRHICFSFSCLSCPLLLSFLSSIKFSNSFLFSPVTMSEPWCPLGSQGKVTHYT